MSDKLFTIVIIHYNQLKYYKTAIDSVLSQDYSNIELIFADDASIDINLSEIENYIEKNKENNLTSYRVKSNKLNLGTVKNLNSAIDICNGDYILFFAADDCLFDEKVISNYVNVFKEISDDRMIVSSQCLMYDADLENEHSKFINPSVVIPANKYNSCEQNKILLGRNTFAVGASAFKKECFEKFGKFNEKYVLVEDWSYMLEFTRKGGKIFFFNFDGLKHRAGGISESTTTDIYKSDIVRIYCDEIFPNLDKVDSNMKLEIYKKYCDVINKKVDIKKIIKVPSLRKIFIGILIDKVFIKISKKTFNYGKISLLLALSIWLCNLSFKDKGVYLFDVQPLNNIMNFIMFSTLYLGILFLIVTILTRIAYIVRRLILASIKNKEVF